MIWVIQLRVRSIRSRWYYFFMTHFPLFVFTLIRDDCLWCIACALFLFPSFIFFLANPFLFPWRLNDVLLLGSKPFHILLSICNKYGNMNRWQINSVLFLIVKIEDSFDKFLQLLLCSFDISIFQNRFFILQFIVQLRHHIQPVYHFIYVRVYIWIVKQLLPSNLIVFVHYTLYCI